MFAKKKVDEEVAHRRPEIRSAGRQKYWPSTRAAGSNSGKEAELGSPERAWPNLARQARDAPPRIGFLARLRAGSAHVFQDPSPEGNVPATFGTNAALDFGPGPRGATP